MKQRKGATNILYGMDSGALSSVTVQPDGTHTHLWTVEETTKRSPITCTYRTFQGLFFVRKDYILSHGTFFQATFYSFSFPLLVLVLFLLIIFHTVCRNMSFALIRLFSIVT